MRPTLVAVAALLLAACGNTASPTEPAADAPTASPGEPADETTTTTAPADGPSGGESSDGGDSPASTTLAPAATTTLAPAATTTAGAPTTTTTMPEPEPEPDPCAESPMELSVADGPRPDIEVAPASAELSPLPDLAVRRINCGGGWVNLRNEIPSDLPVLIWAWAPH